MVEVKFSGHFAEKQKEIFDELKTKKDTIPFFQQQKIKAKWLLLRLFSLRLTNSIHICKIM